MTNEGAHLVDRVRQLIGDVEAAVKESEDRLAYRREHGRELSAAHIQALQELQDGLQRLGDRLGVLLAPPVDLAALRAEYEGLRARLQSMEEPS